MAGALFVVATPIGNLEDLTFRALRTLREVDVIAAEDTRRTAKLLAHYEIQKPLMSVREHNEARETPRLVARISAGESVALVSDAGTPGIADPGTRLVRAVRDAGLRVVPVPGANAIAAALSASGYSAGEFVFLGFPPPSGQRRSSWFKQLGAELRTVVLFEAPHRIGRTLSELQSVSGSRPISVFREITKIHEELVEYHNHSGSLSVSQRGEFTLVVGPTVDDATSGSSGEAGLSHAIELFGHLTNLQRSTRDEALEIVSKALGMDRSVVKRTIKRAIMSGK